MEKEQGFTMSLELLDKTRKIYRLLNRQESDKVDFNDFSGDGGQCAFAQP